MSKASYEHMFARIKSLENSMLLKNQLIQLAEAKDKSQIVRILADTNYGESIEKMDPESFYLKEIKEFRDFMLNTLEDEAFLDVYFTKADFTNLKLFIKSGKTDFSGEFKITHELYKDYLEDGNNHFPHPFDKVIPEAIKIKERSVFEAEVFIDKEMFKHLLSYKNSFWQEYVRHQIDITNFKVIFRCHNFETTREFFSHLIISGGYIERYKLLKAYSDKEENVSKYFLGSDLWKDYARMNEIHTKENDFALMEKVMDNTLISIAKKAKLFTLSVETIIGYILGMEFQLKNLKLILEGKGNNVSDVVIKERLRETYV